MPLSDESANLTQCLLVDDGPWERRRGLALAIWGGAQSVSRFIGVAARKASIAHGTVKTYKDLIHDRRSSSSDELCRSMLGGAQSSYPPS